MVNYGEKLAYWYLRLNGFLLVQNFVLHREASRPTSDADLLGIRLRHAAEAIDGVDLELHSVVKQLVEPHGQKNVGVIVQVKTGRTSTAGEAFASDRIRRGLRFIGALPEGQVDLIAERLRDDPTTSHEEWVFAKLLISEQANDGTALCVSMNEALKFIEERLTAHRLRKVADRLFFPDELMQFLAWRSGQSGSNHE